MFRLLPLGSPTDACYNMALDEALLESVRSSGPTLRFYTWSAETLSVGYFQSVSDTVERFGCRTQGVGVVRRLTGGGIVRHGADLTLTLVLPPGHPLAAKKPVDSYREIHGVILESLKDLFPGLYWIRSGCGLAPRKTTECFEEPVAFDIGLDGRKVAGSSQRRRAGALLHHSAVFLGANAPAAAALERGFGRFFGAPSGESALTAAEESRVRELAAEKYSRADFSFAPASVPVGVPD